MLNKVVPILLLVFLMIAPAYAASQGEPNSVTTEIKHKPIDFSNIPVVGPNSITKEPNSGMSKSVYEKLDEEANSVVADSNSMISYLQRLMERANKGDPNDQYFLGLRYHKGIGIQKDCNEAFKWYTKAAEQGDPDAQQSLGVMYYNGEGVPKDYIEAAQWYRKSAEQGNGSAQQNLGEMYYEGEGVPKDYNEALKWLTMSVQSIKQEQNMIKESKKRAGLEQTVDIESFLLRDTYFTLGIMHYNGEGTPQDYNEAFKWFTKAANSGIIAAQYNIGFMYSNGKGVPKDDEESVKWFTLAAMKGNIDSQNNLGAAYEFGAGVSKNYKEAVKWYRKSAEYGCARAELNLARMYFEGKGVIEDYVEAYKWALIAGMNGEDVTTIKQLCSDKMTYAQIADAQRVAKEFVAKKENEKDSGSSGIKERSTPKASGTGFFISPSGYIITAAHVIEDPRSIQVFTSSGKYQAKVILLDEPTDVAILKVAGAEFPYLEIISSSGINVGDKVFTVGFPNVPIQGTESKYTDGTVSSLSGIDNNIRHFQISIPVQPGNSGGPLVTEKGDVIGVIVSKLNDLDMLEATGTLPQNVNYAVKSAFVLPLLENLPGWQNPKAKLNDEKKINTEIINKSRNAVALILVY